MTKEIEQGNKLIAESPFGDCRIENNEKIYKYVRHRESWAWQGLKYHCDWNWLHDVIDKIKVTHSTLDANEVRFILFELTVIEDIRTVWLSVLTYIKWYNLYITKLVEDFKKHGLP